MKIIPEIFDLVEALTDIAASLKTHHSEDEPCKIVTPARAQVSKAKTKPQARQAPRPKIGSPRAPAKRGQA
jgi:hypothetical protein